MLAAANLADRLSVDVQGAQALRFGAASGDPEAIRAAAKQFEAMFVQIMLKTMRETKLTSEGDPFGDSTSLKLYQELLDQQWAQKMVNTGSLGLADAIVRRLDVEAKAKKIAEQLAEEPEEGGGETAAVPLLRPSAPIPLEKPLQPVPLEKPGAARPGPVSNDRKGNFINGMLPYARQAEAATGVPARFIIAHAALESGWGQHEIVAEDGSASHNLFGIKATGWGGASAQTTTTEYRQGVAMKVAQRFRAYADYGEGFADYARLLQDRYADAAAAGEDAEAFVSGLAGGGYASDPAYADKLKRTITSVTAWLNQV
ncbi:flagellar assembly peptidoglycan hydrolase FlgJ [Parasulfuritortus cantonensis]|uniref:Peptidoglycan hydrolase FlgJ n=1 Tax=Parasulfuritortus cantonensis TaxID=2528202 RepID=A0A4R1BEM0_9PROT|nr:flagellar assembly peptidoglycan hydrolase FlgJ [Parasulfuritortus cantonensis]TCJ15533.1 flagellar assembly peptidoglycan hydrolase FlgJ [Parasulfuritortus cantonensis]